MQPTLTNKTATVLVIEDAEEFRLIISAALADGGYEVSLASDGPEGLELAREIDPDVIILDLGLPGMDGIQVCQQLRQFTNAYIIMVTGRTDEVDKLVGLSIGADDYIVKPFSPRELAVRVQVMLRRPRATEAAAVGTDSGTEAQRVIGDLTVDLLGHEVWIDGQEIVLTKIEFELLAALIARPDMVFTRELLIESVWGTDWISDTHVVDVHIANLRKKLDSNGRRHIKTVRGVGYRIAPAEG